MIECELFYIAKISFVRSLSLNSGYWLQYYKYCYDFFLLEMWFKCNFVYVQYKLKNKSIKYKDKNVFYRFVISQSV